MANRILQIIDEITMKYGNEILLDGNRFSALFSDMAPELNLEKRVIRRMQQEDFLNDLYLYRIGKIEDDESIQGKIRMRLIDAGFSDEWCNVALSAFGLYTEGQQSGDTGGPSDTPGSFPPSGSNVSTKVTKSNTAEDQLADNTVKLGIMAVGSGDLDRGIQYFEEALKTVPDHVGAYLGLVWTKPTDQGKPYCSRLESFSTGDISSYLLHNPEMLSDTHSSLLARAIANSTSVDLVRTLVEAGCSPNNTSVLYNAVYSAKRKELFPILLKHGANPNLKYRVDCEDKVVEYRTVLNDVIYFANDVDVATELIRNGANVNIPQEDNRNRKWSLLSLAVRKNNERMVKLLLDNGADPNSGRIYNFNFEKQVFYCVLSDAIWNVKNINIVKLLLDAGANPNYRYTDYEKYGQFDTNDFTCSALSDVIVSSDNTDMFQLLIEYGADITTTYDSLYWWNDDRQSSSTSLLKLANDRKRSNIAELITQILKEKKDKEDQEKREESLVAEQKALTSKLSQTQGVFSKRSRKKTEARLSDIEKALSGEQDGASVLVLEDINKKKRKRWIRISVVLAGLFVAFLMWRNVVHQNEVLIEVKANLIGQTFSCYDYVDKSFWSNGPSSNWEISFVDDTNAKYSFNKREDPEYVGTFEYTITRSFFGKTIIRTNGERFQLEISGTTPTGLKHLS